MNDKSELKKKNAIYTDSNVVMEMQLGRVLTELLKERRLSLRELARASGVSASTLSEWTTNRAPNPVKLKKVAEYLGVSVHFLLFGCEDNQNPIEKILKESVFQGTYEITVKKVKLPKP